MSREEQRIERTQITRDCGDWGNGSVGKMASCTHSRTWVWSPQLSHKNPGVAVDAWNGRLESGDRWVLTASWPVSLAEPESVTPSEGLVSGDKGREQWKNTPVVCSVLCPCVTDTYTQIHQNHSHFLDPPLNNKCVWKDMDLSVSYACSSKFEDPCFSP